MGRRRNSEPEIELGIIDNFEVEDEAVLDESVPPEECLTISEAKINKIAGNEMWVSISGFGYIVTVEDFQPWMVKGAKIYIMHEGTPGKSDFKIAGVKE